MTAASVSPPGSDPGLSENRASEPSMEDILASIRRIIADDQHATGSRVGGRRGQPANAAAAPIEAMSTPAAGDRDDVLDLAHFTSADGVGARPVAGNGHDIGGAHHEVSEDPAVSFGNDQDERARRVAIHQTEHPAQVGRLDHLNSPDGYETDEMGHDGALLAPPLSESVMSAFEALAATVVLENKPLLEGILRDLLRPMLKAWLDDNLPALVERLVRVEIERVARGGRT